MNFAPYFEDQIRIQERAIRSYKYSIAVLALIGMGIILASIFLDTAKGLAPDLIKLGGGVFTAALATLPYREIPPRRERITSYTHLKNYFEHVDELPPEERQVLTQMAMDAMKENLKR
jgi:hypothetical protein